jgi:hypothetical protein
MGFRRVKGRVRRQTLPEIAAEPMDRLFRVQISARDLKLIARRVRELENQVREGAGW